MTEPAIEAQEDLPALVCATIDGFVADSSNSAHAFRVAGIVHKPCARGQIAMVVASGELEDVNFRWSKGDVIYLNGKTLSKVPPTTGFNQVVAQAKNQMTLLVRVHQPILI